MSPLRFALVSSLIILFVSCGTTRIMSSNDLRLKENTVYIIKADINLNGEIVKVPNNCTLKFDGGKLCNGTLLGSNAIIDGRAVQLFSSINLIGSFKNKEIWVDWFDDEISIQEDLYYAYKKTRDYVQQKGGDITIRFNQPEYHYKSLKHNGLRSLIEFVDVSGITICGGNTKIILDGEFGPIGSNDLCDESLIQFRSTKQDGCNNILVRDLSLVGNSTITYKDKDGSSMGIAFYGVKQGTIEDCKLSLWGTDGIYIGTGYANKNTSSHIIIRNCEIYNCLRQGISIVGCENDCLIENCYIHDIKGGSFQNCIDIECNQDNGLHVARQNNIRVQNCKLENPSKACICFIRVNNVVFENNECINTVSDYPIWLNGDDHGIIIRNNKVVYRNTALYSNADNIDCVVENNVFEACDSSSIRRGVLIRSKYDLKTVRCVFKNNILKNGGFDASQSVSLVTGNTFEGNGGTIKTPYYDNLTKTGGCFSDNRINVDLLSLEVFGVFERNDISINNRLEGFSVGPTSVVKNNTFTYSAQKPKKVALTKENRNNRFLGGGIVIDDK